MTPLVLVHGFMGGSAQWAPQIEALAGHGLIALDLPGFGALSHLPAPARIKDFARSALDQLDARGTGQFDLMGHSMGGMVAQEMALLAPGRVRRLILYGTGATGVLPGRFESIDTSKRRADADGAQATARRIAATWFLDKEDAPAYPACAALAERSSLQAIHAGLDAMQAWDGSARLPDLSAEAALVIWGDGDRTYPWSQTERLWHGVPGARLAVVPGCAHAPHLERPDLFNALVADFLAD